MIETNCSSSSWDCFPLVHEAHWVDILYVRDWWRDEGIDIVCVCAYKHSWRYYWNSAETNRRASGSSRGADWLKRCRELKQAVSLGINSFPPSPQLGMKHMEPIKTWELYRIAEESTRTTCGETQRKERSRQVQYSAFKMVGLSFTLISHQQSGLFSLSTAPREIRWMTLCGVSDLTASIRSANNVSAFTQSQPMKHTEFTRN